MISPLLELQLDERARLDALGFDAEAFETVALAHRSGRLPSPRLPPGSVEAPGDADLLSLPPAGTRPLDALREAGHQLLHAGRAAMIVLNGGMATRFGGHVKGTVDALPGRSFLALHASRLLALASQLHARVPLLVMNSVATEGPTHAHIEARSGFGLPSSALRTFLQSAAPRLRADGSLYRDAHGRISLYGPGHGDLGPSLRRSGALAALREAGVEYLLMANVDNLGAWLDPALLGLFAASGKPMMAEVAPRLAGDVGGSPARVRGRLQLIEGFAFPEGFEQASIPVFNTNTLWFRLDALAVPQALHWYPVRKEADGTELLQFERLVGQLSWFVDCACVRVPRERFLPVKVAEDLAALRPQLRKLFGNSLKVLKNRDPRRNP